MIKYLLIILGALLLSFKTQAEDFAKYFDVDLDSPVPNLEALSTELQNLNEVYEPRYVVSWDMGPVFDKIWRQVITTYGTSEKYLKAAGEDELVEMISVLPKEFYPYIGPFLHTSYGISEKILNMPGIKETKNKFPDRIAPQLEGIEDLEFLSPFLYILLMPEMWPENYKSIEKPQKRFAKLPNIDYNPNFYRNLLKNLPDGGYGGANARAEWPVSDRLRTLKITKTSPLTSADIKSFTNTLDGVRQFATHENLVRLIKIESLLDYYEMKNGTALNINTLKDAVNPCQRLALKIKWAGLENEFSKAIAQEGFNLKDWSYTCDKTIKAYRVINVSDAKFAALKQYKKGVYNSELNKLPVKHRERFQATIASLLEMYKTNENDLTEVLKNESILTEQIRPFGSIFVTSPLDY